MSTVRQDEYASAEEKARLISVIPDLRLSPEAVETILGLDEAEWQEVRDETVRVLIRAMQGEIKESQVTEVRRRLPTFISTRVSDDQAAVVEAIPEARATGPDKPDSYFFEGLAHAYLGDLDTAADLYGQHVAVDFVARIRGQRKFDSVEHLIEAIRDGVAFGSANVPQQSVTAIRSLPSTLPSASIRFCFPA